MTDWKSQILKFHHRLPPDNTSDALDLLPSMMIGKYDDSDSYTCWQLVGTELHKLNVSHWCDLSFDTQESVIDEESTHQPLLIEQELMADGFRIPNPKMTVESLFNAIPLLTVKELPLDTFAPPIDVLWNGIQWHKSDSKDIMDLLFDAILKPMSGCSDTIEFESKHISDEVPLDSTMYRSTTAINYMDTFDDSVAKLTEIQESLESVEFLQAETVSQLLMQDSPYDSVDLSGMCYLNTQDILEIEGKRRLSLTDNIHSFQKRLKIEQYIPESQQLQESESWKDLFADLQQVDSPSSNSDLDGITSLIDAASQILSEEIVKAPLDTASNLQIPLPEVDSKLTRPVREGNTYIQQQINSLNAVCYDEMKFSQMNKLHWNLSKALETIAKNTNCIDPDSFEPALFQKQFIIDVFQKARHEVNELESLMKHIDVVDEIKLGWHLLDVSDPFLDEKGFQPSAHTTTSLSPHQTLASSPRAVPDLKNYAFSASKAIDSFLHIRGKASSTTKYSSATVLVQDYVQIAQEEQQSQTRMVNALIQPGIRRDRVWTKPKPETTHRFCATPSVLSDVELLACLEAQQNIELIEREIVLLGYDKLSPVDSVNEKIIVLDERRCIFVYSFPLLSQQSHLQQGVSYEDSLRLFATKPLGRLITYLVLKFTQIRILFTDFETSHDELHAYAFTDPALRVMNELLDYINVFPQSCGANVDYKFCGTTAKLAWHIRMFGEEAARDLEGTGWTSVEVWESKPFLRLVPTGLEMFFAQFPTLNVVNASVIDQNGMENAQGWVQTERLEIFKQMMSGSYN